MRGGSCNRNGERQIQENVESSYSDDSSADEAKRRKSAGKPKPVSSSSTVTKSSKKAPKKSNKRNKRWSDSLLIGECVNLSPRSHQEVKSNTPPLSGGGGYISYCGTKNVVQRIENILVLVSHFHANPCCCNKTCRISHKIEWLKRSDNFYSLSDT